MIGVKKNLRRLAEEAFEQLGPVHLTVLEGVVALAVQVDVNSTAVRKYVRVSQAAAMRHTSSMGRVVHSPLPSIRA